MYCIHILNTLCYYFSQIDISEVYYIMNKLFKCHYCAFSLVELLMALLVASLLMTALAPVMTKKSGENLTINAQNIVQNKGWRLYTQTSDCKNVQGIDNVCEFTDFKLPKGVNFVNLIMVSAGGGGAGATASNFSGTLSVSKTATAVKTDSIEYDEQIIPITKYMTNVKVSTLAGAGGGGGGAAGRVIECTPIAGTTDTLGNSNYMTSDYNGNCITKYNQRISTNGCWTSYTLESCNSSNAMNYTYSGCARPICTWSAASAACSELSKKTNLPWVLPTMEILAKWNKAEVWKRQDIY